MLSIWLIHYPSSLEVVTRAESLSVLSADERSQVQRLSSPRAERQALTFLAQRDCLSLVAPHVAPREWSLERSAAGQPRVDGPSTRYSVSLSLSHRRDWLAVAINDNGSVGVDVELAVGRRSIDEIAAEYFCASEASRMAHFREPHAREAYFLYLWVLKEAYTKAIGRGLTAGLDSVCLDDHGIAAFRDPNQKKENWNVHHFRMPGGYHLGIAATGRAEPGLYHWMAPSRCVPVTVEASSIVFPP